MGFKLKGAPYDKSNMNIAVYKKDLTDGSIGKSNHTGIIVQSGISPEEEQHVIAHEKVHQEQQAKGDLDYDKDNFYWKGKTYPRANLNEHNEQLPWEKEAYKASEKSRNKESEEMGSTKFKLKEYRGNNKPFSQMTSRGLIGASMNDTDGYSQSDYGSSMYDDGASEGEAGSNYTRKEKRILRKSNRCVKGVDGGDFCETSGGDDSSTRKSKGSRNQKNYLVEDKLNKTTTKDAVNLSYGHGGISTPSVTPEFGLGNKDMKRLKKFINTMDEDQKITNTKNKGRKGTEAAAKSTPLKENATTNDIAANEQKVKQKYLNQKGANKYNTSSKTFDKNFEQAEKNTVGSEKTISRYKKVTKKKNAQALSKGRDFTKDKFKKSVTTKRGTNTGRVDKKGNDSLSPRDKSLGNLITGTAKTKAKLIGKGNKTKSFKLENTEGSGKAVSAKKLIRKNNRFTKQVKGRAMKADDQTKSSRTENRKMNQRKNANQNINQGSLNPTETSRKTSAFNRARFRKTKSMAASSL